MSNTLVYLTIRPNNCSYALQDGFVSGCLGFLVCLSASTEKQLLSNFKFPADLITV